MWSSRSTGGMHMSLSQFTKSSHYSTSSIPSSAAFPFLSTPTIQNQAKLSSDIAFNQSTTNLTSTSTSTSTSSSSSLSSSSSASFQPRPRAFSTSSSTSRSSPSSSLSRLPFHLAHLSRRSFATAAIQRLRNIGISAHIDSGKTTLTERILFYTGRIKEIHEVKGKDNVGATMDHMELEREKGITITSAATHCTWKDSAINIIDTPGHVDFTIEVERSLRVLDGAIMLLCGVAGIQSQSLTVDRQMKRYNVPRLVFINKLDRQGANPFKGIDAVRKVLRHNASAVQIPIGLENDHRGVVDLVEMKCYLFEGDKGEDVRVVDEIPASVKELAAEQRKLLIERVADVDDQIAEIFMNEQEPTVEQLKAAIRRATISLKFVPVFMGSAYKNKGVQPLLDGVLSYLPNPNEKQNFALDQTKEEAKVELVSANKGFVALAFKLEERPFGQLTYIRVYQGAIKKGDYIFDMVAKKKVKVQRIVKMHSNDMEDVNDAVAGEIVALFGIECSSGTTFTTNDLKYTMTSMHVPEPVISLSIAPKVVTNSGNFTKALQRFQREDPTFRVHVADESNETIISGMGELHLEIYVERMKREYKCECKTGMPKVNYRESLTAKASFNYIHKKQSGGAGQFGKVVGYIEPLPADSPVTFVFENKCSGNVIPPEFFPACEKGFKEAVQSGLAGYPIVGVKVVLLDGASHPVDSNEISFRLASQNGFREAFRKASPIILEPIMDVEIEVPSQFQGPVVGMLNRRQGMIQNVESRDDSGDYTVVKADVPLAQMFGYSTDLRSSTEGKGEFSMEYKTHTAVLRDEQERIIEEYEKEKLAKQSE